MKRTVQQMRATRLFAGVAVGIAALAAGGCGSAPPPVIEWQLVKLDADGLPLPPSTNGSYTPHRCVLDEATGLTWSVEHDEPGLLHHGHTFTWYSSNPLSHMSDPGEPGGGDCPLERCDTEALVEALNAMALCGRQDWRLPTREEALSLSDPTRIRRGATLNPVYFPAAVPGEYWTATTFSMYPQGAWVFDARHGHDRVDWKAEAKRVRAVAGQPRTPVGQPRR